MLPAVELLRNQQLVRQVMSAEFERIDATMRLPFSQAPLKIGFEAGGGLVALLGDLREELHYNGRERSREARHPFAGWQRLPRDMAVHPLHRISGREGKLPRQHFVEGDTQSIKIAAGIH